VDTPKENPAPHAVKRSESMRVTHRLTPIALKRVLIIATRGH